VRKSYIILFVLIPQRIACIDSSKWSIKKRGDNKTGWRGS